MYTWLYINRNSSCFHKALRILQKRFLSQSSKFKCRIAAQSLRPCKQLTRNAPKNIVWRGTFFLNCDFTEIGMQTPMIHMNLEIKETNK
jgi:hypothetical protein